MDAAPLLHRDARRCARPGCADVADATLSFRYDLQQAWVMPLTGESSPATYDLCGPCADRTRPPRGWHLVDERPDLDAVAAAPTEHDAVRAAIAAALRGQGPALEIVPDAPAAPEAVATTEEGAQATALPGDDAVSGAIEAAAPAPAPEATVLRSVPDPSPAPASPAAPAAPAARAAATRRTRPRPVEVLISAPPQDEARSTLAGDDELAAALREHQAVQRSASTTTGRRSAGAPVAPEHDGPAGVADFFASRPSPPPAPAGPQTTHAIGTMHVPAPTVARGGPTHTTPGSTSAVLAEALQQVVAGLPVRAANVPLAFDELPDRLVSLGLDELGDFDEADLIAGLRANEDNDRR